MATIKAFKGYRPKKDIADKLASPPYDVLNSAEARAMAAGNDLTYLHVVKPEIDLSADVDLYSDAVYAKGAENLRKLIADGNLVREEAPSLYVYSQKMGDHFQTGLVALASTAEYEADTIKKHEHTKPDKVKDRTKHIDAQGAHSGPVFLTYKHRDSIDAIIKKVQAQKPDMDIVSPDGVGHTVWVISDPGEVAQLLAEFTRIDTLYIADGHHRSASAVEIHKWDKTPATEYFLAVLFPDRELAIMAYNRAVKDLNGLCEEEFLAKLNDKFTVSDTNDNIPPARHQCCMYLGGKWRLLTMKPEIIDENDPVNRIDSAILQANLLEPVLGIKNPRTDQRIDFIGGIRGSKELERIVDNGSFTVAFAMYPVSIADLMSIADAGEVMPPKSTWFEPKLRSGVVVNVFR